MTTMTTTTTKLERAADHIDAVKLPTGEYAHYAAETSSWYVVSAESLAELCDYLDDTDETVSSDAYSHWCAGSAAREMPSGWTPDTVADVADEAGRLLDGRDRRTDRADAIRAILTADPTLTAAEVVAIVLEADAAAEGR